MKRIGISVLRRVWLFCSVGCDGEPLVSSAPETDTTTTVTTATTDTTADSRPTETSTSATETAGTTGTTTADNTKKTTTTTTRKTTVSTVTSISGNREVDSILKNYTEAELKTARFDLKKYMQPVWDNDVMFNESVLVLAEEDGSIAPITLAYDAAYVVEVRNARLNTVYEEGKDYRLENGKLVVLPGGSIPVMTREEYYPAAAASGTTFNRTGGGFLRFSEGSFFHDRQIAVTYVHLDEWQGEKPAYQGDRLKKTVAKLKAKEPVHIVIYGDSIFTGCNASGTQQGGFVLPFMPGWFELMTRQLKEAYGTDAITYANPSVGGKNSQWGKDNAAALVAAEKPDLVIVGFGMNDAGLSPSKYRQNIEAILDTVQSTVPECEFLLTAPMMPNAEAQGFMGNQPEFLKQLKLLQGNGVGVMDVSSVHRYLLTRKAYRDMTGNNVNHPNDFLCRIYAQIAVANLVK